MATSPVGGTPPTWVRTALNLVGVAQLQRWLGGADPYYGFAIQDYADATSDGFRFTAFSSANPPKLAVRYCLLAVAPVLSSTLNGPGLTLEWQHLSANAHYEVWRYSTPYFAPDTSSGATRMIVPAPKSGSTLTYTDPSATSEGGAYCTVLGIDALALPSDPSNYVGVFHYPLLH